MSGEHKSEFLYPYTQINPKIPPRPLLQITLTNIRNDRSIACWALLDSGADYNLFPASIAEALDHNLELGEKLDTRGIGGTVASYLHKENRIQIDPDYPPLEVNIAFAEYMDGFGFGLLGRIGFFNHFYVNFDQRHENFTLRPYD